MAKSAKKEKKALNGIKLQKTRNKISALIKKA